MVVTACKLLDDKSMFVASTAEKFLAKVVLMTVVKKFAEKSPILANVVLDNSEQKSLTSSDFYQTGLKSETSLSSSAVTSNERRGLKRKANECIGSNGEDGPLQPFEKSKAGERQRQIDSALLNWGKTIFEHISADMSGIVGAEWWEGSGDFKVADLKLIRVFSCLLRMSPITSTLWVEDQKITKTFCSLLGESTSLSLLETNTLTELICLQLENLKRLPKLPADGCRQLTGSVFKTVTSLMKDQSHWRSVFQLIPPLFGLCARVHLKECSLGDAKQQAAHLTRGLLSSLRDPSNHFNFMANKSSKQELLSMRRFVMTLIEDLIREDSWVLVEELTAEVLDAVEFVLEIISSHYHLCSGPLVDKLAMQTLDGLDALLKKVPVKDKSRLAPIMHQELRLISSADCNNTVLEKGLKVLKMFLSLSGDLEITDDGLMQKADDVLKKHLLSIHWGGKDSAVNFIGTLSELQNDIVTGWLLGTNLHQEIWDKMEDDENYVRQAAIVALGNLMANQTLLKDLMDKNKMKEVDIARKVALVLINDSRGFARRAAMGLFHNWIKRDGWIRSSVLSPQAWKTHKTSTSVEQCSTIAEVVFLAVTMATRDLDWEVKLSALEFWCEFYIAVIPGLNLMSRSTTENGSVSTDESNGGINCTMGTPESSKTSTPRKETVNGSSNTPDYAAMLHIQTDNTSSGERKSHSCHGNLEDINDKGRTGWTKVLRNHPFLDLLIEKVSDEDRAVCKRACEILRGLRKHLEKLCECNLKGGHNKDHEGCICDVPPDDIDELQIELTRLEGCKINEMYHGCLEGSLEKMAPLLEEILSAAAKESTAKHDMDCY